MTESLASPRLALAFVTMLLVSGIANTFPVFFPPLLAEFGGSRAATASTVTLIWLGGALLGPLAGWLVARGNPRLVLTAGLLAAALGLAAGTLARSLPAFVLAVGIGGGVGVGLTGMVSQAALIADAFTRRRGFATGIAFAGSMAGYALAWPAQAAITRLGWRGALAGYVAAILLLVPWTLRTVPRRLRALGTAPGAPASRGARGGLAAIVLSPSFAALFVVFALPPLIGYLATIQHTLYLTSRGFSALEASAFLTAGGLLSAGGRALAGLAADRWGGPVAGFLSYGLSLAGVLCLIGMELGPARLLVYGYVLLVYLPLGSRATIVSVLVSRIAGPARYGVVFGYLTIGNNLCAALGPFLSGFLYDRTGSYLVIYATAAGLLAVALTALSWFCATTRSAA